MVQCRDRLLGDALVEWCGRQPPLVAVGWAGDHEDLVRLCVHHRPDLVVLEIDGGGWDPVTLPVGLPHQRPYTIGLHRGLRAEQAAQLHENGGVSRLVDCSAGLASLAAAVRGFLDLRQSPDSPDFRLTPREREVLVLLGESRRASEIAGLLGVTRRTVENHKRRIFAKLNVHCSSHAVALAASSGLLPDPAPPSASAVGEMPPRVPGAVALTRREREVLDLADRGYSTKQAARALELSVKTVENIWRHLFGKLGVHDRAAALAAVHRWGYDDPFDEARRGAASDRP